MRRTSKPGSELAHIAFSPESSFFRPLLLLKIIADRAIFTLPSANPVKPISKFQVKTMVLPQPPPTNQVISPTSGVSPIHIPTSSSIPPALTVTTMAPTSPSSRLAWRGPGIQLNKRWDNRVISQNQLVRPGSTTRVWKPRYPSKPSLESAAVPRKFNSLRITPITSN